MAAIDPTRLRPAVLARLLNSVGRGEVISERQLRRHRTRAGYTIGDAKTVDLFRYAAWLTLEYFKPKPEPASYEEVKRRQAERNADLVRAAQDIGEIPEVGDPERKAKAEESFRGFCETYFPEVFYLPWSPDHLRVIEKIEKAVRTGGLFAMAMPRGSGKTVMCQTAVLWSALIGASPFVCLIAASADRAKSLLENIQVWLETNPLLAADFPEVTYPVRSLERITNRQKGQKYRGEPTRIEWTSDKIVLPTIEGSRASGVVISSSGMKGSDIRGQNHARPDGQVVRPQLVMVDDPQTTESAWSPSQSQRREAILAGDVLGMAGPGRKIAGLMACTVIRPDDMADRLLDREKHPEWQGERTKMVYAFPSSEKLWARYAELRADSLRNDGDGREATAFYREHRAEMDAGALVAWPERFNKDEASAVQHAMNLRLKVGADAFAAEYQNEPVLEQLADGVLTVDQVLGKTNGYKRGEVPPSATRLTMFADVHDRLLYWLVCAWQEDFTGFVVEYGTMPDQRRSAFTLADATRTLGRAFPGMGTDGAIGAGLEKLVSEFLAREWRRGPGLVKIDRLLVDSGYKPEVVADVKRRSGGSAMMLSKGVGIRATRKPIAAYAKRPGEVIGHHWHVPNVRRTAQFPHVLVDTNYWKSFVHSGLATAMSDRGCVSLYGTKKTDHGLFAEHVARSERWVEVTGPYGTVREWTVLPTRPDNHWLDCLVGCAAAASMLGVKAAGQGAKPVRQRKRYTQEDLRRRP